MKSLKPQINGFHTLREELNVRHSHRFTEFEIMALLRAVLPQLQTLHIQGKSHGSISLNTLVFYEDQLRLTADKSLTLSSSNRQQDIYSFGIVLIQLLTGFLSEAISQPSSWEDNCCISDQLTGVVNRMIGNSTQPPLRSADEMIRLLQNIPIATVLDPPIEKQISQTELSATETMLIAPPPVPKQKKFKLWYWIITLGLLLGGGAAAFILPSLQSQAKAAKESATLTYLGTLNRQQQVYYLENSKMPDSIQALDLDNLSFGTIRVNDVDIRDIYVFSVKDLNQASVLATATPLEKGLKSYSLAMFLIQASDNSVINTSIICQSLEPSQSAPLFPRVDESSIACPSGSELIGNTASSDGITYVVRDGKLLSELPTPEPEPEPTSAQPIVRSQRVQFASGATGTSLKGTLEPNQTENFLMQLGSGQQLNVSLAQGDIQVEVYEPQGSRIAQLSNQVTQWQGLVPGNGDYIVTISGVGNTTFWVDIDVMTPTIASSPASNSSGISRAGVAIVFDPPSNVRESPNGRIVCSVQERKTINIYESVGDWYTTDVCGATGMIHKSQVRF